MTSTVRTAVINDIGWITLDRPKALNSLSLDMVRAIASALLAWRNDGQIRAVVIGSTSEKAFCAGGDIRFFHDAGKSTPTGGSALLEDFFTEEYALNHLIHYYPKPYIALMDGVVMGGGMGIAQAGPGSRLRIVTERTTMAMPEVNIGLFPDVGGSYFLSRCAGQLGTYLGLTGEVIGAHDAIYAGLADIFLPSAQLPALITLLQSDSNVNANITEIIRDFAAAHADALPVPEFGLPQAQPLISRHFAHHSVAAIMASLAEDPHPFAQKTASVMRKRSPLMMCVTFEQLRRGGSMGVADCLRMERTMVRRCFEHGEVLEGVRALVVDKDNQPAWNPVSLEAVEESQVMALFQPAWPSHAHPLRDLD